ncbi:hypothetical protein HMPREF9412_0979 [Paenibacillus sp. HGF5]|nr:hypothetical protein HMPREF9412_0979 [Paenibacillus sp. HGF5]
MQGEADKLHVLKIHFMYFWRHVTYLNESGPSGLWFFILFT